MSNSSIQTIRALFKMMHEQWLEATAAGVTDEQAHWEPMGKVAPIAAQLAHAVTAEDAMFALTILKQPAPLFATAKTGMSSPPPQGDWSGWGRAMKLDQAQFRGYAQQVYAQTDAALGTLSDADLNNIVDTPAGKMPLLAFLSVLLMNGAVHSGEISAIKGLQGLKGYAF
jgi:hypothetical protein